MTQINVRIDSSLKRQGDAALQQAGYTPSQAIRLLWRKAASHANRPETIADLLESAPRHPRQTRMTPVNKLETLYQGREASAKALAAFDVTSNLPSFALDPYDELMESFVLERYESQEA
ncbi:MAG: type II toxin-antitoxin system RelB/DinJ family antitoxin [Eggerthellaceae bacterium]|nr:type II toxin-antitoxin system RelB/DinJ family antitoxin [Eggerthellaceae bacterium]